MARQRGPIPFVGRIGELSFYKDKVHGYLIRAKGGPSRQQIQKKKSMEPVRQNNSEFGRASAYGALLRRVFKPLVQHCAEYSMSRRLQSLLLSIIKMDGSQPPGQRDVLKQHFTLLQGFELSSHLSYQRFFKKDIDVEMDKKRVVAGGRCTLSKAIAKHADCYKVVSVVAAVDFKKKRFVNDVKESELLPCRVSKEFLFEHSLNVKGTLFYGLVICFYRKNGKSFELITDDRMKAGFISFIE
jgi:hypothetical protein